MRRRWHWAWLWLVGCGAVALAQETEPEREEKILFGEQGWVEFGGSVIPDLGFRLDAATGSGLESLSGDMAFSTGFAVNGGWREHFGQFFALEFLGGFLYHGLDEWKEPGGALSSLDGSLMQVPILINAVLQYPIRRRCVPFAGGGAGAMVSWLDIEGRLAYGEGQIVEVDGSPTEVTFAFQGFAGIRYWLSKDGWISLAYRATVSDGPSWSLEEATFGDSIATLRADDLLVHSVTLGFHVRF